MACGPQWLNAQLLVSYLAATHSIALTAAADGISKLLLPPSGLTLLWPAECAAPTGHPWCHIIVLEVPTLIPGGSQEGDERTRIIIWHSLSMTAQENSMNVSDEDCSAAMSCMKKKKAQCISLKQFFTFRDARCSPYVNKTNTTSFLERLFLRAK